MGDFRGAAEPPPKEFFEPRNTWRGGAATKQELVLQEAAEDTEELICPLITRICAEGEPRLTRAADFTGGNGDNRGDDF